VATTRCGETDINVNGRYTGRHVAAKGISLIVVDLHPKTGKVGENRGRDCVKNVFELVLWILLEYSMVSRFHPQR
jgi:hypothetical protein